MRDVDSACPFPSFSIVFTKTGSRRSLRYLLMTETNLAEANMLKFGRSHR